MKGSEAKMTGFMEGADKRFVIPVYQRKYDWKLDNCRQLFDDLIKIVQQPFLWQHRVLRGAEWQQNRIPYH